MAQIATPVPAVSSPVPAPPSQASKSSHSRTVAVAAGAVGAIVGVIITSILIVLVLRWIKRGKEDKGPANLLKGNSNGAGSTQDGSGKSTDFDQVAPFQNNPSNGPTRCFSTVLSRLRDDLLSLTSALRHG